MEMGVHKPRKGRVRLVVVIDKRPRSPVLEVRPVSRGLMIAHVRIDKEHIAEPQPFFIVPIHILKHPPAPSDELKVAVKGKIVGEDHPAGIPDIRGFLAIQPFHPIVVIGAAVVKVAAAVGVKDRRLQVDGPGAFFRSVVTRAPEGPGGAFLIRPDRSGLDDIGIEHSELIARYRCLGSHFATPGIIGVINPQAVSWKALLIVVKIHGARDPLLSEVRDTFDFLSLGFCLRQRRQKQAGEDGDDGDHDEEFNQGEGISNNRGDRMTGSRGGSVFIAASVNDGS